MQRKTEILVKFLVFSLFCLFIFSVVGNPWYVGFLKIYKFLKYFISGPIIYES